MLRTQLPALKRAFACLLALPKRLLLPLSKLTATDPHLAHTSEVPARLHQATTHALPGTSVTHQDTPPTASNDNWTKLYIADCLGLGELSHELHLPLFKISITKSDLDAHIAELNAGRYAAGYLRANDLVIAVGFDRWSMMLIEDVAPKFRSRYLSVEPYSLRITLPPSFSPADFEELFRALISQNALSNWLATEQGRRHFALFHLDRARAERFTQHGPAHKPCVARADEIYILRNPADFSLLCRLINTLIGECARASSASAK